MRARPTDIHRLRRLQLHVERRRLEAQLLQNQLHLLILELERRYGLLGGQAILDVATGEITPQEVTHEPEPDERPSP